MPLLIPINLMEVAIRPWRCVCACSATFWAPSSSWRCSSCWCPVVLPAVFSLYFDLFDGLIQTVVFVFLTTLFTGEGIKEED